MNDNLFDKKIKAALDNVEVPYDPASWAALEQRLNAPFAEEHPAPVDAVDKAVLRTLERLEAPYRPAHWDLLANRMTKSARLRRRVWIAKLSEAAIFLLLLVNLDGFFGGSSVQQPPAQKPPASNRLQAEIPAIRDKTGSSTGADGRGFEAVYSASPTANYLPDGEAVPTFLSPDFGDFAVFPNQTDEAAALSPYPTETPAPENWALLPDVAGLPALANQLLVVNKNLPFARPFVQVKAPKQSRFYAATFANFDKNYVRSEDYVHTASGYGGGMAIGYRIGKWGAEVGISYNHKHYQPKKEIEIYGGSTVNGFYGSFAKSVDADMVSAPVKITRRIAQFGQMTAHAVAGVTTNIALDKNYQYGSVFYPGQAPPNANADPDQQPQLRKTGNGLLENGSLNGNVYASADAGVRLEHPLGRRFVAFVEPAYRHALGGRGVGPKPAKINTFSVQAGVLATL